MREETGEFGVSERMERKTSDKSALPASSSISTVNRLHEQLNCNKIVPTNQEAKNREETARSRRQTSSTMTSLLYAALVLISCLRWSATAETEASQSTSTCGYPGSPAHASVTFNTSQVSVGTVANYACDNGYELLGPPRRLCQANGTWSPVGIPFCGKFSSNLGERERAFCSFESGQKTISSELKLVLDGIVSDVSCLNESDVPQLSAREMDPLASY